MPGRVIVLSGAVVAAPRPSRAIGPPPCRAVRAHAGHRQRRALDGRQNGGQLLAGLRRNLALLFLLLGSSCGCGQPVAHGAQPANLRPRFEDTIRRVEHEHRTDNATDDQADHEFPALA